jgi:hypothetical protein
MPRWSRQKRGRQGRAHAPRHSGQPLPPRRRRQRCAAGHPPLGRQRERTTPPAPARRRTDRTRHPTSRALGRPRLCLQGNRPRPTRTQDRTSHQQTPPARRADPTRNTDTRSLARQETPPQNPRPPSTPPLARRTHQRLAESTTADRHPTRPQPRQLPRLPPPRNDPHPHEVILRSAPDTLCEARARSTGSKRCQTPLRCLRYRHLGPALAARARLVRAVRARASPITKRIPGGTDAAENPKAADHEDVTDPDHDPAPHELSLPSDQNTEPDSRQRTRFESFSGGGAGSKVMNLVRLTPNQVQIKNRT